MFEVICEIAKMTTRKSYSQNEYASLKKGRKTIKVRPVEDSKEAAKTASGSGQEANGFNLDNESIFFEKYDEHGKVIPRLPQKHRPFGKIV